MGHLPLDYFFGVSTSYPSIVADPKPLLFHHLYFSLMLIPPGNLCFVCSIGAIVIFLEIRAPTDEQKVLVHRYASFMHSFIGRGVCELLSISSAIAC